MPIDYFYQNPGMKLRSILSVSLLSVILLAGCKKDDNDNNQSQADINITAAKWKVDGITANGGIDVSSFVDPCYLDNTITFTSDNKGKTEEGSDVCDPSTAGDFTWSFNSNRTEITMSAKLLPGGPNTFKVVALSATSLVLSQVTNLVPAPVPIEVTVTFSHP